MGQAIDETVKAFELKSKPALDEVYTPAFLPAAAERMPPTLGACT
jgi:hypothetical protein